MLVNLLVQIFIISTLIFIYDNIPIYGKKPDNILNNKMPRAQTSTPKLYSILFIISGAC